MYWLCLYFPDLAWTLSFPGMHDHEPGAVSACGRIVASTGAAQALGVVPGLSLEAAFALLPDLQLRIYDAALEERWLERQADAALRWTSRVCCAPSALLLEIQASERLFQGRHRLTDQIMGVLAREQRCQMAGAPTQEGALWLARVGLGRCVAGSEFRQALAGLRLQQLPIPESESLALETLGLRQVREAWRLPRSGVRFRFPQFSQLLGRALGEVPEVRAAHKAAPRFEYQLNPEWPLTDQHQVLHALDVLLEQMEQALKQHALQVRVLHLCLRMRHQDARWFRVESVQPQAQALSWGALWREQLRDLVLPQAVQHLRLRAEEASPLGIEARDWFGGRAQRCALVDLLRARLPAHVHGVRCAPDHRPERAWAYDSPPACDSDIPRAPRRPLWLLPAPVRLDLLQGRPCRHGVGLKLQSGPERIQSGWWDGADIARDYFVAEDASGGVLWVFRECVQKRWFLHGIFA